MTKNKRFFLTMGVGLLFFLAVAYFSSQRELFGAPQVFISAPATTTRAADFGFTVGTTTPLSLYGSTTLAIYGSTTIQTPVNTLHAFRIINAASSTIFSVDTVNASTTVAGQLNAQTLTVTSCTGCGAGLSGGSVNTLTYWTSATAISATSSPTVGYLVATTTTPSIFTGGFISQASSTFSNTLRVSGNLSVDNLTSGSIVLGGGTSALTASSSLGNNVLASDVIVLTEIDTSSELITIVGDETGSGVLVFGTSPTIATPTITGTDVITDVNVVNALTVSGGTVNNSAIGATTPLTGAFTTLSHTGLLSAFGNITGTSTWTLGASGVFDAGAAASLEIPNAASPTVDATGEIAVDTTTGQLKFFDGSVTQVHVSTSSIAGNFSSTTLRFYGGFGASATATVLRDGFFQAVTVTEISCRSRNATTTGQNTIFQIGTGGATATPVVFCNSAGQVRPITANGAFAVNTPILITVGSATSVIPDNVFFDIRYKYDSN